MKAQVKEGRLRSCGMAPTPIGAGDEVHGLRHSDSGESLCELKRPRERGMDGRESRREG